MNAIWLEFLHNMAVFGVRKTEDNKEMQLDYCPFGGDNWCFPLDRKLITQPSLLYEEWEKERLIDGSLFTSKQGIKSARFEKTDSPFLGVVVTENPAFIQGRFTSLGVSEIEKIFHAFYEEIKESSRLEDRYKAVARCLRKIVVIHAFPYGNLRTSMMLLLILFYQIEAPGLPILEPSYLLGAKRLVEIVEAMQEGTEDFTEKLSYQKRHTP